MGKKGKAELKTERGRKRGRGKEYNTGIKYRTGKRIEVTGGNEDRRKATEDECKWSERDWGEGSVKLMHGVE